MCDPINLFFNKKKKKLIQPPLSNISHHNSQILNHYVNERYPPTAPYSVLWALSASLLGFYLFVYTLFIYSLTPTYVSMFCFKFILQSPLFQFCSRLTMVVVHSPFTNTVKMIMRNELIIKVHFTNTECVLQVNIGSV